MKTINFYKKTDKVFSVYAESLENVINSPLSYFQGYTNDMIITDITYQYPIFKDDVLREMTKEEKNNWWVRKKMIFGELSLEEFKKQCPLNIIENPMYIKKIIRRINKSKRWKITYNCMAF